MYMGLTSALAADPIAWYSPLADPTDALFSPACLDTRRQTEPGCEVAGGLELLAIAHLGDDRGGRHRTFTWS